MCYILSMATVTPPHMIKQQDVLAFAKQHFTGQYTDIERYLPVFQQAAIDQRFFTMPLDWYTRPHTFEEKNDLYIKFATELGVKAIRKCLQNNLLLKQKIDPEHIDAIIYVSSSGVAAPGIEARMMNKLSFSAQTKRIPLWGLGCAGGAAGLSRAYDYCSAYPAANVLLLNVELCSLTFQHDDFSKGNLVGTALFADGVACTLVSGTDSPLLNLTKKEVVPRLIDYQSTLKPHSEEVMGWRIKDNGFYVLFSKHIPTIVKEWVADQIGDFLRRYQLTMAHMDHLIAHPGGRKVLDAYEQALQLDEDKTGVARMILREYGNMSSATILFVLEFFVHRVQKADQRGLLTALGPGFSSELLLLQWDDTHEVGQAEQAGAER